MNLLADENIDAPIVKRLRADGNSGDTILNYLQSYLVWCPRNYVFH